MFDRKETHRALWSANDTAFATGDDVDAVSFGLSGVNSLVGGVR